MKTLRALTDTLIAFVVGMLAVLAFFWLAQFHADSLDSELQYRDNLMAKATNYGP